MSASKRQDSKESRGWQLSSVVAGATGLSPALIVGLMFFIAVMGGIVYGWKNWGRTVVARPIYRIAVESIEITPPPAWIRTDVRAEIVHDGALNDLTIFDKDATIRVYQAFELHPWVSKVLRVSKHPPARLLVDLEYRQPVAWVEVAGAQPGAEGGVIPIDRSAFVLPSRDFTKDDLNDYLRISIRDVRPYGLAGTAWGDSRVVGAAKVAVALKSSWQALRLFRIQLATDSEVGGAKSDPVYELETATHQRILWGNAPGTEASDEPSAAVKLARLMKLAEPSGSLEKLPTVGIDLRNATDILSTHTAFRDQ